MSMTAVVDVKRPFPYVMFHHVLATHALADLEAILACNASCTGFRQILSSKLGSSFCSAFARMCVDLGRGHVTPLDLSKSISLSGRYAPMARLGVADQVRRFLEKHLQEKLGLGFEPWVTLASMEPEGSFLAMSARAILPRRPLQGRRTLLADTGTADYGRSIATRTGMGICHSMIMLGTDTLAIGDSYGRIGIWHLKQGYPLLRCHLECEARVPVVSLSCTQADSAFLLAAGGDNGDGWVFELSGERPRLAACVQGCGGKAAKSVSLSNSFRHIIVPDRGCTTLVGVAFTVGTRLACATLAQVSLWDASSGMRLCCIDSGMHPAPIRFIAASHDRSLFAVWAGPVCGRPVCLVMDSAGTAVRRLRGKEGQCWESGAVDACKSTVAASQQEGFAFLANFANPPVMDSINLSKGVAHSAAVHCVSFSSDGKLLATMCRHGTLRVWDTC